MKKGSILQIDDFSVGMFVTVHNGYRLGDETTTCYYDGKSLLIASMQLPYVVMKTPATLDKEEIYAVSLDIRRGKFIELSDEYVKALNPIFFANKEKNMVIMEGQEV